jgi:hypothetical protein
MTKSAAGLAIVTGLLVALAAASLLWLDLPRRAAATASVPLWKEVSWPFPMDPWGRGKAFRCRAADCGADVTLYVRAKIGFCDCVKGVADDDDLDRMGDLFLVGGQVSPLASGRPVAIAWMKGRSRAYRLDAGGAANTAISIVYNERCDMIAATAVLRDGRLEVVEHDVIEFLNSPTVMHWAEIALGL